MVSSLQAMLPALVTQLKLPAANPNDLLLSKLSERAHSSYETDQTDDSKPRRGIEWSHVCGNESDVDVVERDVVQRPSMELDDDSSIDSLVVVDELLKVAKYPDPFGRTNEKDKLISQFLENSNIVEEIGQAQAQISVIFLVGIGGIGKTMLARMVYEDKRVQEHFELKAWVKMGGQDQNQLHVARRLLKSATGVLCTLNSLDQLDEMIFDAFLSKRILIVLDDVESITKDLWLHMKNSWFSSVGFGSKVMITSRKQKVADDIAEHSQQFRLGKLSEDDSWSLFASLAFTPSEKKEDYSLIQTARCIVDRCNGVPLSLKLLGSLIRFEKGLLLEETCSIDLMEIINCFRDDSFVLPICVLALPMELFKCLAYCGIFPSGYVMDKEKLIKMWIAEGLVKPSLGAVKQNLEDIGEAYFHQLLCRSFFVDVNVEQGDQIVQAQMPSVVYEITKQIAAIVLKNKVGYVGGIDKSIDKVCVASPFKNDSFKHVQTLVSLPTKNLEQPNQFQSFVWFKRLQSLDLSRSRIRELPKHICSLKKLKYLNLSYTLLTKLPKSIRNLTLLQTLDLSSCYCLQSLPSKTSSLSQLRHLDLSQCNSLYNMPPGMGRLVSLVTLNLYVVGGADLGELHGLNDIRGVMHIRNLENVKEISEAKAAGLKDKKLHHLGLSWSHKVDDSDNVLESLQPNPDLQVLELIGYGGSGPPSWVQSLRNLVKLLIEDCRCNKLPTLGQLPSLQELQLKELISIESIGEEFYGNDENTAFPSLEKLKLHGMPNFKCWSNPAIAEDSIISSQAVFPVLKRLSIQDCPKLQSLPSSLDNVRELVVWRSHSQLLMDTGHQWLSLSSIVINDMAVTEWVRDPRRLKPVKKLILVGSRDLQNLESSHIDKFTDLQHLRILHCLQLKTVKLTNLGFLQKLNMLDCQNLHDIHLVAEIFTLTELVVEDCPRLTSIKMAAGSDGNHLRKLIVRNCPILSIETKTMEELRELEMFFINGCPQVEERLNSLKSNLSFVIIRAQNSIENRPSNQ